MRILIFPEYPWGMDHVLVETVYETLLPRRGHRVHFIRPRLGAATVCREPRPGGDFSLITYPAPASRTFPNALRDWRQRQGLQQALALLSDTPVDVVLVRNDLITARVVQAWTRRRGIPWVLQVSSPDAEFTITQGRQCRSLPGLVTYLTGHRLLWWRRRLCRRAGAVLAISDAMRHYMVAREGIAPHRCFSFPMGFSDDLPLEAERVRQVRRELGLPAGRTMVYSGTIHPRRDPGFLLAVLARVQEQIPGAALLILAKDDNDAFKRQAAALAPAVTVLGPLPPREVGLYLRCADVMLSPIPPQWEYNISSPTKSLEGLGMGLPVVGNVEIQEHAWILGDSGGGLAVPYEVTAFAQALIGLLQDEAQRRRRGAAGQQWVLQHRTYSRLTAYLEHILEAAGSTTRLAHLPHRPEALPPGRD